MISMQTGLMVMAALALLFALGLNFYNMRRLNRLQQELAERDRHQAQRWQSLGRAAKQLSRQQQTLNRRLRLTTRRQQELELRDIGNVTYNQAGKMVAMGAASEDLMQTCGLSRAEARLVSLMHQGNEDNPVTADASR